MQVHRLKILPRFKSPCGFTKIATFYLSLPGTGIKLQDISLIERPDGGHVLHTQRSGGISSVNFETAVSHKVINLVTEQIEHESNTAAA